MEKERRVKFAFLVILCFIVMLPFSGCNLFKNERMDKYFIYRRCDERGSPDATGGCYRIKNLTDLGREQEVLYIPDFTGNKLIVSIGDYPGTTNFSAIESEVLKKLYLPRHLSRITNGAIYVKFPSKLSIICNTKGVFESYDNPDRYLFYVSEESYSDFLYSDFFEVDYYGKPQIEKNNLKIANTDFKLNYEGAGTHWIDNFEQGEKIAAPPQNPTRKGYTFGGWYRESGCINKWNFETGLFELDSEEISFKLYAKWTKN